MRRGPREYYKLKCDALFYPACPKSTEIVFDIVNFRRLLQ